MDFRLLGLLEVTDESGPVRIVAGHESALLALLLIRRGEALLTERIVEELWAGHPPENAVKSVQVYVSRLRKSLGADRIETTPAGYRIRLEPGELDVERFERLVREGDFDEALALWHGEALADFRYAPFAQAEARRLEELRNEALASRIDAQIAAGGAPAAIADLDALVARDPLWERPRGQLMRALYLAGRQAEALALYRATRELLAEELGIEPGPELQRLERAILNHDPELGTPVRPPPFRARGARLVLAGGLLVLAAVAAAVVLATRHSGPGLAAIAPNSVAAIDARNGRLVAQIAVGERPSRIAIEGTTMWVLNAGQSTIDEVDLSTGNRIGEFGPTLVPADLAATPGEVWIGDTLAVARFDAARRQQVGSRVELPAGGGPPTTRPPEERYLVTTPAGVWAVTPSEHAVRLDPKTGAIEQTAASPVLSLAFGDGSLWGIDRFTVVRLDPRTGVVTGRYPVPSLFYLGGIASGGGYVFATSSAEGVVWRIDPRQAPAQTTSIPVAFGVSSIAWGDGAVWIANRYDGEVDRIDPVTRTVRHVASIPAPQDLAVAKNRVYVAAGAPTRKHGPLTTSACAPVDSGGGKPDVLIASDLPLRYEGPSASIAVATIRAVLRSHRYRAGRFRVGYQSCDDSTTAAHGYDDGQCVANAGAYADDVSFVGVIGTYDSGCALDEIPILNRAAHGPLAMISPFDTGPFLTRRGYAATAQTLAHVYAAGRSFFRVIGADHIQVAADAELAQRLGVRRVAIVYDRAGMLQSTQERWFARAARLLGLTPVPVLWNGNPAALAGALRAGRADGAFLVSHVARDPHAAAQLSHTLSRVLAHRPVILTDQLPLAAFAAGSAASVYGSVAGVSRAGQLPAPARALLRSLPARDRDVFAVGETAEATTDLLAAIAASNGSRASIVRQLRRRFDKWGDPTTAPVAFYRFASGATHWFATITPSVRLVPPGSS